MEKFMPVLKRAKLFSGIGDENILSMLGGISKKLAYRLLQDESIQSVRIGRSYKIPKVCVIEYLTGKKAG